ARLVRPDRQGAETCGAGRDARAEAAARGLRRGVPVADPRVVLRRARTVFRAGTAFEDARRRRGLPVRTVRRLADSGEELVLYRGRWMHRHDPARRAEGEAGPGGGAAAGHVGLGPAWPRLMAG